jgi:hypothetical protein
MNAYDEMDAWLHSLFIPKIGGGNCHLYATITLTPRKGPRFGLEVLEREKLLTLADI